MPHYVSNMHERLGVVMGREVLHPVMPQEAASQPPPGSSQQHCHHQLVRIRMLHAAEEFVSVYSTSAVEKKKSGTSSSSCGWRRDLQCAHTAIQTNSFHVRLLVERLRMPFQHVAARNERSLVNAQHMQRVVVPKCKSVYTQQPMAYSVVTR